jgi:hypothetical protein
MQSRPQESPFVHLLFLCFINILAQVLRGLLLLAGLPLEAWCLLSDKNQQICTTKVLRVVVYVMMVMLSFLSKWHWVSAWVL